MSKPNLCQNLVKVQGLNTHLSQIVKTNDVPREPVISCHITHYLLYKKYLKT